MNLFCRISLIAVLLTLGCSPHSGPDGDQIEEESIDRSGASISEADCQISSNTFITSDGIGALHIGRSASEISRSCTVVNDNLELDSEALPQRVITVEAAGQHLRVLTDEEDLIWRIEIATPVFRTTDSLGVGTQLNRFLKRGDVEAIEGDGHLYILVSQHCGLSFRVNYVPQPQEIRVPWPIEELNALPAETSVDQVLIVGCKSLIAM